MTNNSQAEKTLKGVWDGFIDFVKVYSIHSPLQHATFQQNSERAIYCVGVAFPTFSGVIETEKTPNITEEHIDNVLSLFNKSKLPFLWWTAENKKLEKRGFQFGGVMRGISLDLKNEIPTTHAAPSDLKVKQVKTDQELKDFNILLAKGFGMDSELLVQQTHAANHSMMKEGSVVHYLGYIKDLPVGVASISFCPDSAGIWNFTTLPEYRRKGIGTALLNTSLAEAKKRGYKETMAILMPKGMAWGVFRQKGFKEVCDFPFYVYGSNEPLEK